MDEFTSPDKIKERILLLKRFLPYLELGLPPNYPIKIGQLARSFTDAQLERLIQLSPLKDYYTFRGKYYTVRKGGFF